MQVELTVIFPHQLFSTHPALQASIPVWIVETDLYFNQFPFHKAKLLLHRASMKAYAHKLSLLGFSIQYVDAKQAHSRIPALIQLWKQHGIQIVRVAELCDHWLEMQLKKEGAKVGIQIHWYSSPYFLNSRSEARQYKPKRGKYFQTDFYQAQRIERNILVDQTQKPVGGKWTFDTENRKKMPASVLVPPLDFPPSNLFLSEAYTYVQSEFPHNPGELPPLVKDRMEFYPITHDDTRTWWHRFLEERFVHFGIYEDAMRKKDSYLFHSVLTPMLNIGLITPEEIIREALQFGTEKNIPLNSVEGFVRQVMGWREFIRIVYEQKGSIQRTTNYWNFHRKIPRSFYTGTTGIEPVDQIIQKLLKTGYNHHIERLMVLGNFMLLCEFDPNAVYQWFMEMYVDSYDWVMVPNVYGMTQFADGGLMTTKPYISGSNYLLKMGDFSKGPWQEIWDGLFWRFMNKQRHFFNKNPRLSMLLKTYDAFPPAKKEKLETTAETFLQSLDHET